METFIIMIIFAAAGWIIGSKLTHLYFRKEWVDKGKADARLPYPYRFNSSVGWVNRYYNRGYDSELELIRQEKEKV